MTLEDVPSALDIQLKERVGRTVSRIAVDLSVDTQTKSTLSVIVLGIGDLASETYPLPTT